MASETLGVSRGGCGATLPTARPDDPAVQRPPCPECGSTSRHIRVAIHETLKLESHVAFHSKHPRPSYKNGRRSKPARERWAGDSLTRDDDVWRSLDRVVDREGD
jgi:hypothetical protein